MLYGGLPVITTVCHSANHCCMLSDHYSY